MPINRYECEKCRTLYDTIDRAIECEDEHPTINELELIKVSSDAQVIKGPFPKKIALASIHSDEIGYYVYEHAVNKNFNPMEIP